MLKWSSPAGRGSGIRAEPGVLQGPVSLRVLTQCVVLEFCLEEELLRTLGAVVDLVFLPVDGKDVLLQLIGLDKHCEADGALEGATHALEAVLDQVAQELGRGVKHLVTQLALVVDALLDHVIGNVYLDLAFRLEGHLAFDALICLLFRDGRCFGRLLGAAGLRAHLGVVHLHVTLQVLNALEIGRAHV